MKKQDFSKRILKKLSGRPALPTNEIHEIGRNSPDEISQPARLTDFRYAINRSLKNLEENGLIEKIYSAQSEFTRLTKEGKKKVHSLTLENETTLVNTSWDGFWRIILLDLPESRKSERESLRYLLKKANFICLKNSAWISPHPYEHLFMNIKKDLGLTTEMMIIVTKFVDDETQKVLFEAFRK